MRLLRCLLAAALIAGSPAAVSAASKADGAYLAKLQADDLRLQTIGWKLVSGNARFCAAMPAIGLLVQDMANYGDPAAMRMAAGISGEIAVQAVVPGGPAALAGLAPNDEIIAVDGRDTANLPPAAAGDWKRLAGIHDAIENALARDGDVRIAWRHEDGQVREDRIAGAPVCPTRFELDDGSGRVSADGRRVLVGRKFAGLEYAEDELAAALAHEIAHNLFAHRAWLNRTGRKQANVRTTEREADRLMPWLLANAGYDPAAAVRFFERWGPAHDGGLFRARSHDGWDERADFARGELPEVARLLAERGYADWRANFRRETSP